MADLTEITLGGVKYDVKDGPFQDEWHMVYWLVVDSDGTEILLWEDELGVYDDFSS